MYDCKQFSIRIGHLWHVSALYQAEDVTNTTLNLIEDMESHNYYYILTIKANGQLSIKQERYNIFLTYFLQSVFIIISV